MRECGWRPKETFDTGLRRTVRWYLENRAWVEGVRTGDYLYVEHASRERELYDLRNDPREVTNLVDRPGMRRVVRLLAHELDLLRNCKGAQCRRPLPPALRTTAPAAPLPDGRPD